MTTLDYECLICGDDVPTQRWALGYFTCLSCGEAHARQRRHCSVPLSKSNYVHITDPTVLRQLNPKHNLAH